MDADLIELEAQYRAAYIARSDAETAYASSLALSLNAHNHPDLYTADDLDRRRELADLYRRADRAFIVVSARYRAALNYRYLMELGRPAESANAEGGVL